MGIAFSLKKRLILSYFEKKKVKTPFDEAAAEGYQLPADAGINVNNSHFFTASNESGETLSIRLGMRNNSDYEIFVLWRSRDGRFFVHEKDSYSPAECPVKFTMIECGKRWRTEFKGVMIAEGGAGDSASAGAGAGAGASAGASALRDAEICVEFEAGLPIYDFVYHADRFNGMADAIAREKWSRDFFTELGRNNQRHYEQTGHISGSVIIGGETFAVDLPCVRDHSFGLREWDLMNDHIWLCCQRDNGEALSFSIVNYPRMKRIFSGYTNISAETGAETGAGANRTLRDYEIVSYDPAAGVGGKVLQLICWFPCAGANTADAKAGAGEGCQRIELTLTRTDNVKCVFGGGKYVFQEGLADFSISIDGGDPIHARGTLEYGFNANSVRWEGYSKL